MSQHRVFISYSHKDEVEKLELEKWLGPLSSDNKIMIFSDSNVIEGKDLLSKINQELANADIILLLVSQDYLTSSACNEEMEYALQNQETKTILPIIIKNCTWKQSKCFTKKVLPKDGMAIEDWKPISKGWLNTFEGITRVIEDMDKVFSIRKEFYDEIQRVEFIKEQKRNITLDDIFIFPFITKDTKAFECEVIKEAYFHEKNSKASIIIGSDFCGKTSLLRHLFKSFSTTNPTLLIDGKSIHQTRDFKTLIKKVFDEEFKGDFHEWYSKPEKIALIDNFHHEISSNFLDFLQENFSKVIITMSDEEFMVYFKDDKEISFFQQLSIDQLPLSKQEELIIKWINLSEEKNEDKEIDYAIIDQIEDKINNIISLNRIVPRFPFYILSILQTLESFMPDNLQITSYGHCYHALIVAQLLRKGVKGDQIDTCFNYLSELANSIYRHNLKSQPFLTSDYSDFKKEYTKKFIISNPLLARLEGDGYSIIDTDKNGKVIFTLEYIYLFFLGKYLAENYDPATIDNITDAINRRQNSMILIFTVHHTKNKDILETILLHCICTFDSIKPAELSTEETRFMSRLLNELPSDIASGKSVEENRQELHEQQDKNVVEDENDDDPSLDEINKGLRIIEVLGQILKNRAGSFEKSYVQEILEYTIDLGLRILNLFLGTFRKPEFVNWLITKLDEDEQKNITKHKHQLDYSEKKELVEKNIQIFGYMITVGIINRITYAIFSEKLTFETSIISKKNGTPAYILISYLQNQRQNGINISNLENIVFEFDKTKNFWAKRTLSYYVQHYLNTHRVTFKNRQKVLSILGITQYIPNKV